MLVVKNVLVLLLCYFGMAGRMLQYTACLSCLLLLYLLWEARSPAPPAALLAPAPHPPRRSDNCYSIARESRARLTAANISLECAALEENGCPAVYDRAAVRADPLDVLLRSAHCNLDWAEWESVSPAELAFPLAYFITAYTDARQLELLLATVFRPHNAYCIHVDSKADSVFVRTVKQLVECYRARYPGATIILPEDTVSVYWGHFSIVEAELTCLRALHRLGLDWRYAVNLAGSELQIFTNKEMVANLSGAPDQIYVESFPLPANNQYRVEHKWRLAEGRFDPDVAGSNWPIIWTGEKQDPVPYNLTIFKGAKSYRLPRKFVRFLLAHPVSRGFLAWAAGTAVPDETVVPTLARVSRTERVAGRWVVEQNYTPRPRYHYQNWAGYQPCAGTYRNAICVLSLRDLPVILQSGCSIVNKFRTDFHPYVTECLVEVTLRRALSGL